MNNMNNNNNVKVNIDKNKVRKQKTKRRRPIHIIFKKVGSFFKREVNLYFEFSLSVKKSELNKSNTLKEVRK